MGLFSRTDLELAQAAVDDAVEAWEKSRGVFVYKMRAGIGSKNDTGWLLTMAVDGIVKVGWRLHSLTPYINTIGPNNEEVLMTFERPTD